MRVRGGVIQCYIWHEFDGDFAVIIHYVHTEDGPVPTAAYTRYNGELTNICEKFRTLRIEPDWRNKIPSYKSLKV